MAPPRKKQRKSLESDAAVIDVEALAHPTSISGPEADSKPAATNGSATPTVKKEQPRRTLFVRSLPPTTTTEILTEIFSQSHPVRHATAVTDPATGQCRGYGFVTFADQEDAEAARKEFHGMKVGKEFGVVESALEEGKKPAKLRVEIAEPRSREKQGITAAEVAETDADSGSKRKRSVKEDKAQEKRLKRNLETGTKIIVRNLPWSIKSGEQLGKHFEKYGNLKSSAVPRKNGGLLQGFGFVTFKSRKSAEAAVKQGSGIEIDGRSVAVDWAVQKEVFQEIQAKEEENEAGDDDAVDIKTEDEAEPDGILSEILSDSDMDMKDEDDEDGASGDEHEEQDDEENDFAEEDRSGTLFVRNLPFTCTDEDLEDAFRNFGAIRYARVVMDHDTDRSRGTGFVCFYNPDEAAACVRAAPQPVRTAKPDPSAKPGQGGTTLSVLQDETLDPSGKYTVDGRVLQVAFAVNKSDATRLTKEGVAARFNRDKDRRRLFLLAEGNINTKTALWQSLSPAERAMRESSTKQRRTLVESNPSLHLSLTRLSIRNIPRSVTSKDLKQLAREAVVGFATDVKAGKRERLSREEIMRGGEEMKNAEQDRRAKAKGLVKQAKIVFEGREGGKVEEKTGAGRSRGYGFIEYHTHRNALMGLRWLNGHMVDYKALQRSQEKGAKGKEVLEDRKKRLIVEFAIENAQVVQRRKEKEGKARERDDKRERRDGGDGKGRKRKRDGKEEEVEVKPEKTEDEEKVAKRARIIQKKRMMRRAKKQGKVFKT